MCDNMKEFKKKYDDGFKLKEALENEVEDLYITSKFPPFNDVSGIVFSKRIIKENKKVDVVYSDFEGEKDYEINSLIDNYIENRIIVDGNYAHSTVTGINHFRKEGMKKINKVKREYKNVVSRTWTFESHFLALDYKLEHPEVKWIAEFSDPMRFDVNNNLRKGSGFNTDPEYFETINEKILALNSELFGKNTDKYFPNINPGDEIYLLVEYLPFLFADVVRFTNKNQREIMLSSFPYDIKEFVLKKSEVSRHPTLDEEYYYLKESNQKIDENYLNFAYFGTYLGKRHLEYLFKSFEEVNENIKNKMRIYLFVPNPDLIKLNLNELSIYNNIIIGEKLPYLEFLNLTTKMDILIVNDLLTTGVFDINPYLPSKFADYLGSGKDIWCICEKNSSLDKFNFKYKSHIIDYESTKQTLGKIVKDKLNINEGIFNDDIDSNQYYQDRITNLNNLLEDVYKQRMFWLNQNNLSKNKINELNNTLRTKDENNASLIKKQDELKNEIQTKTEQITTLTNQQNTLKNEIQTKTEQITTLTNQQNALKNNVGSNNELISSLMQEKKSLQESLQKKIEENAALSDKCNELNKEIENLKQNVLSVNAERKKLCDGYFELHEIAKDSFDLIETKDNTINDLYQEIDYYKNQRNILRKLINSPLEYAFLVASSSRKEMKLNYKLLKLIKEVNWFNKGFYLNSNKDVSRLKWAKVLSPELHYICHGIEENRLPNRETKENTSKKDLLKKLTYLSNMKKE